MGIRYTHTDMPDSALDLFLKWELKTSHYKKIPLAPQGSPPHASMEKKLLAGSVKSPPPGRSFTRICCADKKSWILMQYPLTENKSSGSFAALEKFLSVRDTLSKAPDPCPRDTGCG